MSNAAIDLVRMAALLKQFNDLPVTDNDGRNNVLDELQDAVGFAGRMVMERDILKKAESLLKANALK